eukprot:10511342-Karenia_brevis.AAC.1
MLPVFLQEMKAVKRTIDVWHYVTDHTTILLQLNYKMAQGVKVRLIFDRGKFYYSSSAHQALRVLELWNNSAKMKVLLPSRREGGGR